MKNPETLEEAIEIIRVMRKAFVAKTAELEEQKEENESLTKEREHWQDIIKDAEETLEAIKGAAQEFLFNKDKIRGLGF